MKNYGETGKFWPLWLVLLIVILVQGSAAQAYAPTPIYFYPTANTTLPPETDQSIPNTPNFSGATWSSYLPLIFKNASPTMTEATLWPVADAHVDSSSPGTNFGNTTSLVVDLSPSTESFLRFDLSGITGAVLGARLRLFIRDATDIAPMVYATSNNWIETDITWNTKPLKTGSPIKGTGTLALNTWVEYNITSLVSGEGIYSFHLLPESSDAVVFTSRESGATSQRPQLVVTFDPNIPETIIQSGPPSISSSASALFTFSSNQPDASFECTLDGSPFIPCSSPYTYSGLSDGSHAFQVQARNQAGYRDPSPASRAWIIDTVAPTVTSVMPANLSTDVALSPSLIASFSERMDTSTLSSTTFTLVQKGSSAPITSFVSYDLSADQAVLTPISDLTPSTTYIATIIGGPTGLKDEAGNSIAVDQSWSFTTGVPQIITFDPIADAKVDSTFPSTNYGTIETLTVDSSPLVESFLQFTVSGFPNGVTNATLQLWVTDGTSSSPNIYAASNAWTETGLTWNNKPPAGALAGNTNLAITADTWVEYDVTSLITGEGTYTFDLTGTSSDSASFASREAVDPSLRPKLVVIYEPSLGGLTVSASPKGGIYTESQLVTLTSSVQNGTIYYTTDLSDPRPGSSSHVRHTYQAPLNIPVDTPLKFVVVAPNGRMSSVMTEVFTIDITQGYEDFSYLDIDVTEPTGDKTESKLWFNDGSWWGVLYNVNAGEYRIYRFDLPNRIWIDTGTTVDKRKNSRADTLWDGSKLYISTGTTYFSEWGNPPTIDDINTGSGDLLRFSYNAITKSYSLDQGFPVTIRPGSAESMTITRDSTGRLWIAYTAVTYAGGSPIAQVWVNHSLGSDTQWGAPFVPPIAGTTANYDDIATIIAFGGNKIGLMWPNQNDKKFFFAVHNDGDPDNVWQPTEIAYGGGVGGCTGGCANDHLNIKTDSSGRIFAGIKTANRITGQPFIVLLVRGSAGDWTPYTFSKVEDEHSRPRVLIDEQHNMLYLLATIREVGGAIFYKVIPLNNLSQGFPPGPGISIIQNPSNDKINDSTSTKQNLSSVTGLLVLANDNSTKLYLHNYLNLGP